MGITKLLPFNPCEWRWTADGKESNFFNYTSKIGYLAGMAGRKQESRLQEKLQALNLSEMEIQAAITLIWDKSKPAKLQYFAWQVASGGLFTGSRAVHMGYPGACACCRSGLTPKGPETIFKPFLKFGQAIVEGHSYQKFMN
jgi:hypothetical protein